MLTTIKRPRRTRLVIDTLRVETFEAGAATIAEMAPPTHFTGIDSTCPCCSDGFTCETVPLPCP